MTFKSWDCTYIVDKNKSGDFWVSFYTIVKICNVKCQFISLFDFVHIIHTYYIIHGRLSAAIRDFWYLYNFLPIWVLVVK